MEKYVQYIICYHLLNSFPIQVVYTTSATISGLTKGEYEVSVSARNQYTVASPDDLLKGPQMSLQQGKGMHRI